MSCATEAHDHQGPVDLARAFNTAAAASNGHHVSSADDPPDDSPAAKALRRFFRCQETRTALWREFEDAFESNLKSLSSSSLSPPDASRPRDVSDPEMRRVIDIATTGMLEIKSDVAEIASTLRSPPVSRDDLAELVESVQAFETEKLSPMLMKQQARRMAALGQDDRDFASLICSYDRAIAASQERVGEAFDALRTEFAEL